MLKKLALLVALVVLAGGPVLQAKSNDGWDSELGHVGGSALMAGAGTAVADYFDINHRAWWGFAFSVAVGFAGESLGDEFSTLDFASDVAGAALGAWVTDKYILKPVVVKKDDRTLVGMMVGKRF